MRLPGRLVLLGHPLGHTLSPLIHNAALKAAGIPVEYSAFDVPPAQLSSALRQLKYEKAAGNVTVPHKAAVRAACDSLSPTAERAGAVNTFWFEDGRLIGDNTDVGGVEFSVRRLLGVDP